MREQPIGFFDSGVGGLSVLLEVKKLLPYEEMIYFADNKRQPYGIRSQTEVGDFVIQIIDFLAKKGCKACVIACNTATAAGLKRAQESFDLPIIGVITPGVLSAVETTKNNKIILAATVGTLKSRAYHDEISKLAPQIEVFERPCPKFVSLVETGNFTNPEVYEAARDYFLPLKKTGVDTIVLGCTHYPFLVGAIGEVVGPEIRLCNPGIKTAELLKAELINKELLRTGNETGEDTFYTTGDIEPVEKVSRILLQKDNVKYNFVDLSELIVI